jgi:hypothetical protein
MISVATDGNGGGSMENAKKDTAGTDGNRPSNGLGRREFLGAAAAALFAGVVIQITGCSSDDNPASSQGGNGDVTGFISENHPSPHKAVITKAMVDAGGAIDLDITGSAGHSHTVSLTADQMALIKSKLHVMLDSSAGGSDSHKHMVMFN